MEQKTRMRVVGGLPFKLFDEKYVSKSLIEMHSYSLIVQLCLHQLVNYDIQSFNF